MRKRRTLRERGGYALPMVLLVLVVLTVMAAASIQMAGLQHQAGAGALESTKAFYAAEAGAHAVIAEWDSASYDTLVVNPGDSTDLGWRTLPENGAAYRAVIHRVSDKKLYGLTIEGWSAGPLEGQQRLGLLLKPGFELPEGAIITRGTIDVVNDAQSTIDGNDTNPPGWSCDPPVSGGKGVLYATGTTVSIGAGTLLGDPALKARNNIDSTTFTKFGDYTYQDLVAMADKVYTDSIITDFVGPAESGGACDTGVRSNWGDPLNPAGSCGDYFPIIHFSSPNDVQFRLQAGSVGQGILLVDSRLDQDDTGGLHFYGLIITQSHCDFEHKSELYGSLMCSNPMSASQQIHDSTTVRYSTCALRKATASLGGSGVAAVKGSWKKLKH